MRALWLHDLRWAGPLALAGALVQLGVLGGHDLYEMWTRPDSSYAGMNLGVLAPAAAVLALVAALFDELTRTREYLRHRPLDPRRVFWARQALALAVVLGWVVLDPALHLLAARLLSANAAIVDGGRLWLYIAQGLPALFVYALVVFAASLARHLVTGVLLALTLALALTLTIAAWMFGGPAGSTAWVLLVTLALAPPLLVAAERCQREARDADRPWSARRLGLAGSALVVVAGLAASPALTTLHAVGRRWLHDQYPRVVPAGEGLALAHPPSRRQPHYRLVDGQHAKNGQLLPPELRVVFGPKGDGPWQLGAFPFAADAFPGAGTRFRGLIYTRAMLDYREGLWGYVASDGFLYIHKLAQDDGEGPDRPYLVRAGKGSPDRPFSPQARLYGWPLRSHVVIHDPEDGGVWGYRWDARRDAFTPLPLPGGDRVVGLAEWERTPGWADAADGRLVVEGTRGLYLLADAGFVAAPANVRPRPPERSFDVRQDGATRFTVTVEPDGARPGFRHEYAPHTAGEHLAALMTRAPTLVRPLPLSLASLAVEPRAAFGYFGYLLLDQPVTLGDGAALAGNALLSLLLAALAYRRLGALGAGRGRRLFWAAAVLLGGGAAFLCQRAVETARAWRPIPAAAPAPAPAPLVLLDRPATP